MSTLAGMLKIAWRVGSRRKKEEAIVGDKMEKTGNFFFVQTQNPSKMLMLELPVKQTF